MTAWQEVRDLVVARRTGALADRVATLTEAERAEVAGRLPELLNELRETAAARIRESVLADYGVDDDGDPTDEEREEILEILRETTGDVLAGFGAPLRVAGAGTISGPAAVAAWLTRREFNPRWVPQSQPQPNPADVVRAMSARPAGWRADVASRVSGRIRTANDRVAPLALALLRACGGEPPEHDPLVVAWLSAGPVDGDPLIGPLLPRIFEAQGAGRVLRQERLTPRPTRWLSLTRRLLATGRVSREELLDGCVSRFLRGGDAADLRFFVRLHEMIDPTPEEAAARARDYLRLLPAAPGTVAELALAQVRRTGPRDGTGRTNGTGPRDGIGGTGGLDGDDVAEAIGALTFRAEVKLARAGLSWLAEEVRRAPARAGELAPALVTAFAHTSYEVQGRAAQLAVRHAAAFGTASAVIAEAVPLLPPALGARVSGRSRPATASSPRRPCP